MRSLPFVFALVLAPVLLDFLPAQLFKPVTNQVVLQGTVSCAKCNLGESTECIDVLESRSKTARSRIYFATTEANGECRSDACRGGTRLVRLTGIPYREAGKKWIAPIRIESASAEGVSTERAGFSPKNSKCSY